MTVRTYSSRDGYSTTQLRQTGQKGIIQSPSYFSAIQLLSEIASDSVLHRVSGFSREKYSICATLTMDQWPRVSIAKRTAADHPREDLLKLLLKRWKLVGINIERYAFILSTKQKQEGFVIMYTHFNLTYDTIKNWLAIGLNLTSSVAKPIECR